MHYFIRSDSNWVSTPFEIAFRSVYILAVDLPLRKCASLNCKSPVVLNINRHFARENNSELLKPIKVFERNDFQQSLFLDPKRNHNPVTKSQRWRLLVEEIITSLNTAFLLSWFLWMIRIRRAFFVYSWCHRSSLLSAFMFLFIDVSEWSLEPFLLRWNKT